jgi:hypothetical protein
MHSEQLAQVARQKAVCKALELIKQAEREIAVKSHIVAVATDAMKQGKEQLGRVRWQCAL